MPRRQKSATPQHSPAPSPQISRAHAQPGGTRHRPQPSVETTRNRDNNLGMSPEARYEHNLKVLRRRDPSIISIFDQFTHVCVYHHNGEGWEKNGYEGSMFLYERDTYPPYGFYILNRMGMEDYVQRLYPEDITGPLGTYLMLRSYPEYTTRRMSKIHSHLGGHDLTDKFSSMYFPSDLETADKGPPRTVCLWMFPTDAREPMLEVMNRLQGYVKRNEPYPDQYRYGPGRPPPPNPHLRTTSPSPPLQHAAANGASSEQRPAPPDENPSEIDKLFSKLAQKTAAPSQPGQASGSVSVASLFASVNGNGSGSSQAPATGLALLDSIFASAAPAPAAAPSKPTRAKVHSPTPSTTPQVLNHDVITSLLRAPARAASAASLGSSREGDNEYEIGGNAGSDGFGSSEGSTVLDPDAELDEELQAAGASAGRPLLSALATRAEARHTNGTAPRTNGHGRVNGDVTPRPPMPPTLANGHLHPPTRPQPPPMSESSSTIRAVDAWTPVDDLEDGEIVELDFEDTSALSDPAAFREAQQRSRREHLSSDAATSPPPILPNGNGTGIGTSGTRRGKGRKKGKRERAAERALENARLAQLIDPERLARENHTSSSRSASASPDPTGAPFAEMETPIAVRPPLPPVAAEPAPAPAPALVHTKKISVQSLFTGQPLSPPRSTQPHANSTIDPAIARASIIASAQAQNHNFAPRMERNEFVREVLTLIHTDSSFVDALWQDYNARSNGVY
ncbi:hypothetical protein HMN09_00332600 [Mycena chlorophos]|uniref:Uncharacterized protein n=1 Tax=Mycena chlorophos TaxID=658473 RepID=A0A8H6WIK5_MYCCL|nr:hypothetical protein HMN09_00332600 [Mycena chlorophos]